MAIYSNGVARFMTADKHKLDTWKEISDYLERSVRTVQRWERERGLPIRRLSDDTKERVFAYADEIDAWLHNKSVPAETEQNGRRTSNNKSTQITTALQKTTRRTKLKWGLAGLAVLVTSCVIIFLFIFPQVGSGGTRHTDRLYYEITEYGKGSRIDFYDGTKSKVLTISSEDWNYKSILQSKNILCIADVNNDGLKDVLFSDYRYSETLDIHIREDDGSFKKSSWDLSLSFNYQGKKVTPFGFYSIKAEDINGNGKPEIIIIQRNFPFYATCCRIFNTRQETLLTVWHPGALNTSVIFDRDDDGLNELYLCGTNNFITTFSAPVCISIACDWNRCGQILSFFGENRTMAKTVPEGIKVSYINFKKDYLFNKAFSWEVVERMIIYPGKKDLIFEIVTLTRAFYLDKNLNCFSANFLNHIEQKRQETLQQPEHQDLLTPVYWNGASWREEVCYIPQGPSYNAHQ